MVEYSVVLRRHKGSSRPDVYIFSNYDRETAIMEMRRYVVKNGFTVYDHDGRFTVADVVLIEKEPIVGAPILSETPYIKLFDVYDNRRK